MYCKNCGKQIDDKAFVCVYCGVTVADPQQPVINIVNNNANTNTNINGAKNGYSTKSKSVAFLLCLFLGVIGAHRFYVGKIGTGIIYLLTCGFGFIGIIIDLISIICGKFRDSYGLILI